MRAVAFELRARPSEAVRARVHAVGPEIRAPADPRRGIAVLEIARRRIDARAAPLLDLRLHRPLHGETRLIRVRLRVERGGGVTRVDAAGDEDQLQVRIARLQ